MKQKKSFPKKRLVSVAVVVALLCGTLFGLQMNASAMPDFNVDSIDSYANYGFHEVAETPLIEFTFEDAENSGDAMANGGSVSGSGSVADAAGAELVDARWQTGQALHFTGKDNYLTAPDLGELDAMTFSAWLKVKDFTDLLEGQNERVMTILDTATGAGRVTLKFVSVPVDEADAETIAWNQNSKLVLTIQGNKGGNYAEDSVRAENQDYDEFDYTYVTDANTWMSHLEEQCWINIAFVYDPAAKTVTFYHEGKLDSTQEFTTAVKPVLNGIRIGSGYTASQWLDGAVDDIRIYDKALSAEDVAALADFERDLWAYTENEWEEPTTTLYVDGEKGNDDNAGTKDAPFATVKKGVESIKEAGTRLVIAPGVYREAGLNLRASGTAKQPIIIEAEKPGETIINGSSIINEWKATTMPDVYVHEWPYDFPTQSVGGNDFCCRRDMLIVDGQIVEPAESLASMEVDTYFLDEEWHKVYFKTKKLLGTFVSEVPDISLVDDGCYLLKANSNDYLVFRGLTFTNMAGSTIEPLVDMGMNKHLLVEDCVFKNNSGTGLVGQTSWAVLGEYNEDWVIRRSTFDWLGTGSVGMGMRGMNMVTDHCNFTNVEWKVYWGEYSAADCATSKQLFVKNFIHRDAYFDNNFMLDLWFDNMNWNIEISESAFYNNRSDNSIYTEINPPSMLIRDNVLESVRFSNSDGTILDNNIIVTETASLFNCWSFEWREYTGKNTKMTNNIFLPGVGGRVIFEMPPFESVYDMYASGNKFFIPHGKAEDEVFNVAGEQLDFESFADVIGDETAEFLTENPFLDDGTATVSFKDAASTTVANGAPNYIPVVLSKPLRKEVSVNYTIWNYDTGEKICSGVLEFGQYDWEQDIYVGDGDLNVLIELTGAKDIQLGEQTLHYQTKAE